MTATVPALTDTERSAPEATCAVAMLDDLDRFIGRYVAFPSNEARWAVALWAVHCHTLDAFESTPRLALLSAEKGSGKTRTLEVLGLVVPEPLHAVNLSAAALYRVVADKRPTLLLDEADTYLGLTVAKQHEDLRGLINAGHGRGAKVYRGEVSGKAVKVVEFPAFAPCALAGIGDLPDTILDRAILVAMRRRAPHEHVEPFRERLARPAGVELHTRLARWAIAATIALTDAWPTMPPGITDRAADVWEPLLAVADHVGGHWSDRARQACVTLNAARQQRDPSLGVQLLGDCRRIFTGRNAERLTTDALLEALVALDESPWGDLRGKPIDARGLARRLRRYEVRPGDHRFDVGTRKGYLAADFHDAWTRYLPPVADAALVAHPWGERGTPPDPAHLEAEGGYDLYTQDQDVAHLEAKGGYDLHKVHQEPPLSSPRDGQQGQHRQRDDPEGLW